MLNKMLKWRKKNSKGFSLVELIIVIAIMAILVGILAPQFIQYVNKSRVSTDIKNYQEVVTAVQVYCADEANATHLPTAGTTEDFYLTQNAAATAGATITLALTAAGMDKTKIIGKSSDLSGSGNAKLTVTFNANGPSFAYTGTNASKLQ